MRLPVRFVLSSTLAATLTAVPSAQTCNTWQPLPPPPVEENPINALAFDPVTQNLFQATADGTGDHSGNRPWIGLRVGNAWQTVLDPAGFFSGVAYVQVVDVGAGPEVYAYGGWTPLAGQSSLMRWNGSSFVNVPSTPSAPVDLVVFDAGAGPELYAAAGNVYRWTGSAWSPIATPGPAGGGVRTMVVHDDGTGPALYVAGKFTSIGGVAAADIARWNGVAWSALGSGIAGQPTTLSSLRILKLLSVREEAGPRLYAAGGFLTMDGQPANSIASFDGTSWTGVGTSFGQTIYNVSALASFDDGTGRGAALFAMGQIAIGQQPSFFKRLDSGVWSDAVPAGNGMGTTWDGTLLVADLPETPGVDLLATIYGGTGFGRTTGRLEACDQTGRIYCTGDGASVACPCGNNSAVADQSGCVHSGGTGGAIRARGRASVAADTLRLDGSTMRDGPCLYYQGTQSVAIPFGDGVICALGTIVRLQLVFNQAGASSIPALPTDPSLAAQGFVTSPGTRYYSARYRDGDLGYCTSGTFNYTNAVAVVWNP